MTKYYVDVEHIQTYRIPIEADDDKAASAAVAAMIDDGAMPEDIGEWHDDEINTGSAWVQPIFDHMNTRPSQYKEPHD